MTNPPRFGSMASSNSVSQQAAGPSQPASSSLPCPVCFDQVSKARSFKSNKCGHSVCVDCMHKHLEILAFDTKQFPLPCPVCRSPLDPTQCFGFVANITTPSCKNDASPDLCAGLNTLVIEKGLMSNIRYCANTNCRTPFEWIDSNFENDAHRFHVRCAECNESTCVQCHTLWHEGLTCEENRRSTENGNILSIAENNGWKPCPSCGHLIEKHSGDCSFVVCRCGCGFCHTCGKAYLSREATFSNAHGVPNCTCTLFSEEDQNADDGPIFPMFGLAQEEDGLGLSDAEDSVNDDDNVPPDQRALEFGGDYGFAQGEPGSVGSGESDSDDGDDIADSGRDDNSVFSTLVTWFDRDENIESDQDMDNESSGYRYSDDDETNSVAEVVESHESSDVEADNHGFAGGNFFLSNTNGHDISDAEDSGTGRQNLSLDNADHLGIGTEACSSNSDDFEDNVADGWNDRYYILQRNGNTAADDSSYDSDGTRTFNDEYDEDGNYTSPILRGEDPWYGRGGDNTIPLYHDHNGVSGDSSDDNGYMRPSHGGGVEHGRSQEDDNDNSVNLANRRYFNDLRNNNLNESEGSDENSDPSDNGACSSHGVRSEGGEDDDIVEHVYHRQNDHLPNQHNYHNHQFLNQRDRNEHHYSPRCHNRHCRRRHDDFYDCPRFDNLNNHNHDRDCENSRGCSYLGRATRGVISSQYPNDSVHEYNGGLGSTNLCRQCAQHEVCCNVEEEENEEQDEHEERAENFILEHLNPIVETVNELVTLVATALDP